MKNFGFFCIVLALLWTTIQALPVAPQQSSSPKNDNDNSDNNEIRPDCNDSTDSADYDVHLDQLIQHITTHWKFDHLDSIQTQSYKHIATQVQQHVRITVKPAFDTISGQQQQQQQQQLILNPSSVDAMDVDILMAQIFGAIQSHTQGKLPLEWDRLGDQLGKPALESYLRRIVLDHCGPSTSTLNNNNNEEVYKTDDNLVTIISAQCLLENSNQLSAQLDRYIGTHLIHIFDIMDRRVLPDLLTATSDNLRGVLEYFNSVFLNKDDQELLLEVIPWQGSIKTTYMESILPSLNKDTGQSSHFFTRYTCLARI